MDSPLRGQRGELRTLATLFEIRRVSLQKNPGEAEAEAARRNAGTLLVF